MRIAIDTLMIERVTGDISSMTHTLLEGLARIDQTNEYIIFTAHPRTYQMVRGRPNMRLHTVKWGKQHDLLLKRQFLLPDLLKRLQPDVLHVLAFSAPIGWNGPLVMTVPDLGLLELFDKCHPFAANARHYWHYLLRESLQRAERVIVTSEHTSKELVSMLAIEKERITACDVTAASAENIASITLQAYKDVISADRREHCGRSL
jgi:hypothetical protein